MCQNASSCSGYLWPTRLCLGTWDADEQPEEVKGLVGEQLHYHLQGQDRPVTPAAVCQLAGLQHDVFAGQAGDLKGHWPNGPHESDCSEKASPCQGDSGSGRG